MKNVTTDTLIEVNGEKIKIAAWLRQFAKERGYKVFKTKRGELSPNDFAKLLFDYAVSGSDPDDDLCDYFDDIAEISSIIEDGIEALRESNKSDSVKKKSEQDSKKDQEQAQLAKVTSFGESMSNGALSTVDASKSFVESIRDSFPSTIQFDADGAVVVTKEASVEDVGIAFGAAIQFDRVTKVAGNMLAFIIGELTNAAVVAGVYKTKKECAADIAERLEKSKVKTLSVSAIENLSRMAERIPPSKRVEDVPATIYQAIACVKQPKQKIGEPDKSFKKRKDDYQSSVDSIIDAVNSGEISDVKEAKKLIDKLQKSSDLKSEASYTMGDFMKIFMEASMLMTMVGKDGEYAFISGSDDQKVAITRDDLKEIAKSALSHYTNMRGIDPSADLSISELMAGYMEAIKEN